MIFEIKKQISVCIFNYRIYTIKNKKKIIKKRIYIYLFLNDYIIYYIHSFRMHMHVARCSSAVKRTALPWYPDCRPRPRDTTGSTGSPLKPQTGSSCLLVKPKRSRRTGSLPFRKSSTDPWCRRSTQVCKHTRSTERNSPNQILRSWLYLFLFAVEAHFKHKPWCWL